jgi:uncharacterized protein (DUF433 family)
VANWIKEIGNGMLTSFHTVTDASKFKKYVVLMVAHKCLYAGLQKLLFCCTAACNNKLVISFFQIFFMSVSLLERITINPEIGHGKPTIRNKRYTVEGLLEYLAGGDSIEDLLKEFPDLEKEDFLACLQYAVLNMKHKYAEIKAA